MCQISGGQHNPEVQMLFIHTAIVAVHSSGKKMLILQAELSFTISMLMT